MLAPNSDTLNSTSIRGLAPSSPLTISLGPKLNGLAPPGLCGNWTLLSAAPNTTTSVYYLFEKHSSSFGSGTIVPSAPATVWWGVKTLPLVQLPRRDCNSNHQTHIRHFLPHSALDHLLSIVQIFYRLGAFVGCCLDASTLLHHKCIRSFFRDYHFNHSFSLNFASCK
mmetsp:Transcript_4133/g.7962  ORF Transcript_4133/g.7962 Transcript_4133/m.7962 type:complete len:168 (-) Transcript_4133:279-782(-)